MSYPPCESWAACLTATPIPRKDFRFSMRLPAPWGRVCPSVRALRWRRGSTGSTSVSLFLLAMVKRGKGRCGRRRTSSSTMILPTCAPCLAATVTVRAAAVSQQQSAEVLAAKLEAFGWYVLDIDGHAPEQLSEAFDKAGKLDRPLAVVARTVKGWGVNSIVGKNFHGKPIPPADLDEVCRELDATGVRLAASADVDMVHPLPARPKSSKPAEKTITLPPFDEALDRVGLSAAAKKRKLATRAAYGAALVALGDVSDRIVSLDADVSNSTFANHFARIHPDRFFECKIAEQNMISVGAGLAAAGKIPFISSFAKFLARATDQIDMATISRAGLKIVGLSFGRVTRSRWTVADVHGRPRLL